MKNYSTDRDFLENYIWDVYKDVNGIRPRWMNLGEMSLDDLNRVANDLEEEVVSQINHERGLEEQSDMLFNFARLHPRGYVWSETCEWSQETTHHATILPEERLESPLAAAFATAR